jgi:uncharacterized protein YkwD
MRSLLFVVTLLSLTVFAAASDQSDLSPQEQRFFELINEFRTHENREALTPDSELMEGARFWATQQGQGHAPLNGFNGECLAPHGYAIGAFVDWLDSSGHRKIMLGQNYKYGGIGFDGTRAVFRAKNGEVIKQYSTTTTRRTPRVFRGLFRR